LGKGFSVDMYTCNLVSANATLVFTVNKINVIVYIQEKPVRGIIHMYVISYINAKINE